MRTERRRRGAGLLLGGVLLCSSASAPALVDTRPFASVGYEHDDNVYRFADEAEAVEQRGSPALDDTLRRLEAGTWVDADYGRQALRLFGVVQQYRYGEFSDLDRIENEFEGRLDWALGIPWTGHAYYGRSRTIETLTDRDSTELGFQRRSEAELFAGYAFAARWQLQGTAGERRKRLTRPAAQGSDLDETYARLGFAYASAVAIVGAAVQLTDGRFPNRTTDSGVDAEYEQTDVLVNARNNFSGVSSFETELGYTIRTSPSGASGFRGPTGKLRYEYRWLANATIDAQLFRRLRDTEEQGANYVEELGTALALRRTFTPLLSGVAELRQSTEDYHGAPAADSAREDSVTRAELGVAYAPRSWISVKPLLRHERRSSNRLGRDYDFTSAGLAVEVRAD